MIEKLKGWKYIVYVIIENNFSDQPFSLREIYEFIPFFETVYPKNYHIQDKIRQTLQYLRNENILAFESKGVYRLLNKRYKLAAPETVDNNIVYILSNESIPNWIKIGRTNSIDRRLKELYNTSVPLPFELFHFIKSSTYEESLTLEKSIHSIIDTINPSLRKNTAARRREFFRLTPDEGKAIFDLVGRIMGLKYVSISDQTHC